ncbi:putative F-box domain-containing protein [Rosa chinensis]|uniref:Putative F-box domain-containing protein n=1 Tax=Rosa chinensis TaxID=74649 RepID=A0A2P6QA92_ROSCH|nr:F-box/kelch-repeat protein At3g23880 [Rosa chinensis]XP_040375537.1 F-box/kelch-repeat protein At3g23880 [Rosa chinensis]XP_040375538.1 F-box/kelch-repeat protein At3g23880 [Rosa chinensis]XP_040375539.1 F-box/kelch-repeat protein At3g23880 [Rosa chinensis]PRQ31101.1 putative F-box domain-containing protein [Rosa chinensis]
MWEDCYEGKSLLSPESASKLCLSITHVFQTWLKSLPKEIIPNILIRLPIKSLIKFTSVCKSWRSTIKDPSFIRTHLTHTLNFNDQNATHLILLHTIFSEGTSTPFGRVHISGFQEDSYCLRYDNNDVSHYCKVEFPIGLKEKMVNPCLRVVGTCDGLVLLADDLGRYAYNFVVWNPCVRKYVTLSKPSVRFATHGGYDASLGLGYDAIGNDYKVVRVTTLLDQPDELPTTLAQVYSLATGSWGMLRVLPPCQVPGSWVQASVNGTLHWLALRCVDDHYSHFVVAFDVGSESYREIMLPKCFKADKSLELRLCASGDRKSIGLFVRCKSESDCFLDIWVMKEYCIEKSWTKLMILTPQGPKRSLPEALCFRRNGEVMLVLEDDRELVSLDIGNKQFKNLGISGGQVSSVDSYEESLVLLDRKDAISY